MVRNVFMCDEQYVHVCILKHSAVLRLLSYVRELLESNLQHIAYSNWRMQIDYILRYLPTDMEHAVNLDL